MIRLRQVALVAEDRDAVVAELCEWLGVSVCFEDPGVGEFGLHNALMTIGDQFLEVVSPTIDGTTAGRLLDKRGGDGGYMAIFEVDDLDVRQAALEAAGVRVVWSIDLPDIRARHLHPRDVGGAIVSIDQPVPSGTWRWAGPWTAHTETSVATAIAGIDVAAADPVAMRARWSALGIDHAVRFVAAGATSDAIGRGEGIVAIDRGEGIVAIDRGEGIVAIDMVAADRSRSGESRHICGVDVRLV